MGFWDTIKDVAKIGLDSINAYNVEMQELKQIGRASCRERV